LFTGHYSVSFAGRATEKRIPLWLLFIAVQFIDVLWSIFVLLGIEKVRIVHCVKRVRPVLHALYAQPFGRAVLVSFGVCGLSVHTWPWRQAHWIDPGGCGVLALDS
jgi:hypothetical protein